MRRIGKIDLDTGELLGGHLVYVAPKRHNGFREGWTAMLQKAFGVLKMFTRSEDLRVMMALLEQLDYENQILVNQASMARELGMEPPQVNRAIKRLLESGAILKVPKKSINCLYQLNPEFGWKGSGTNHKKALEKQRKQRMKAANITGIVKTPDTEEDTE